MKIEEFLEKASREHVAKPESKRTKRARRNPTTIGDGMRTTAKLAAATTVFTILVHSAPMLLAGVLGAVVMFRGCSFPKPIPIPKGDYQASHVPSIVPKSPNNNVSTERRINKERVDESASLLAVPIDTSIQAHREILQPKSLSPQETQPPPSGQSSQVAAMGSIQGPLMPLPSLRNFNSLAEVSNGLADVETEQGIDSMIDAAIFDFRRGKTYSGTCQMPGSSSKRMSLSIDAIRDQGTNVQAKLSLLESPRTSKKYTGTVEADPPRLILTPLSEGNGFGTFLTYMPWYSNSPTTITLDMSKDGMQLQGRSSSSEEFDLVARNGTKIPKRQLSQSEFDGFDAVDNKAAVWNIQTIDSKQVDSLQSQSWRFTALEEGLGTFVWIQGGKTRASGTYKEDINECTLDIVIPKDTKQSIYRGLISPDAAGQLKICVAKEANGPRPTDVSSDSGKVYEIICKK